MSRVFAAWTRPLDGDSIGRVDVARAVRAAIAARAELAETLLPNLLQAPRPAAFLAAARAFAAGLLRGRPVPLQCLLFAGARMAPAPGATVYADGLRCLLPLRALRRRDSGRRIVVDLDDLLSRRTRHLLARRLPLAAGFLERALPRWLAAALASPRLARLVLAYEHRALRHAEREMLGLADRVVLLNRVEARLLRRSAGPRPARAAIVVIPPPAGPAQENPAPGPWRCVFVGSDRLVQNRLTIDYLVGLWARFDLALELEIYGRQTRPVPAVGRVHWRGYVAEVAEAYRPGAILLCPSFLRGGIKTKILGAAAHGAPVIGNSASFEGLDLPDYPLAFTAERDLLGLLRDPGRHTSLLKAGAAQLAACLRREHAPEIFAARWATALGLPA